MNCDILENKKNVPEWEHLKLVGDAGLEPTRPCNFPVLHDKLYGTILHWICSSPEFACTFRQSP